MNASFSQAVRGAIAAIGSMFETRPQLVQQPFVQPPASFWGRLSRRLLVPGLALFCLVYGSAFALFAPFLLVQLAFPLVALALVVIWALPDTDRPPDRELEALLFAFLIGLVLWPRYLALALPGLPWITITRLAGIPLMLSLLVCMSVSYAFRQRISETIGTNRLMAIFFAIFLATQLITIPLAASPVSTMNRVINAQVSWTAIFIVSAYVFSKPGRVERAAGLLWALAIIVGIVGVAERPIGHVPWANYIPSILRVEDESVARILVGGIRMYAGNYRVQSTFTTSLGLAEYLGLTIPFILHFAVSHHRPLIRACAWASIPFIMYIVLLTDSRLGLIASLLSFLAYILLAAVLRWRRTSNSLIAPAVVLAYPFLFALAVAATFFVGRIRTRIWGGQYQSSNDGRVEQITMGIPKVLGQPIGHGMGEAAGVLGWVQPNGLLTIDNYWLAAALDYGIIGLIAFLGFFISAIILAAKQILANDWSSVRTSSPNEVEFSFLIPLAIALLNFVMVKLVFADESNHALPFMMAGMVMALTWRINQHAAKASLLSHARPEKQPRMAATTARIR